MRVVRPVALLFLALLAACFPASLLPSTPTSCPTATSAPVPTPTSSPSPTPTPTDLYLPPGDVRLYPGPDLYSGDRVTFDVTPRNLGSIDPADLTVRIYLWTEDGPESIAEGVVGYPTFDRVPRARLTWAWDTSGLEGEQVLTVRLDPDDVIREGDEDPRNNAVNLTVRLLPAEERPPIEVAATWATTTTACCEVHYLTGTAAERDLPLILAQADEATDYVETRLQVQQEESFSLYLIGRVIGHGGYAQGGDRLVVSYLDRHYAGDNLREVLRHEITHVLDAAGLSPQAPALLREGLAVWVAGGHFKPEPIRKRGAAILRLGWYIPLGDLAEGFYTHQHEIGYAEAAAFVAYLVDTYGRQEFRDFYAGLGTYEGGPVEVLDGALMESFGRGLDETETDFRGWLEAAPPSSDLERDLEDTVRLFDMLRRYQQVYDPGAYFASGWFPDPVEAERRGIVADFLRHPRAEENIALETMLIVAREALENGEFDRTERLLEAVEGVLEQGDFADPLAATYLGIVRTVAAAGYEVQRIDLEGETATVWAIARWPTLEELRLVRTDAGWQVRGD